MHPPAALQAALHLEQSYRQEGRGRQITNRCPNRNIFRNRAADNRRDIELA